MKGWIDICSDVHWIDHGGTWGKKGKDGAWYLLRFIDMWGETGFSKQ